MGEVYLAQDTTLGREVALKLLPVPLTSDATRLLRFKQEARAASALNHPNIVTIHEIGEADGHHFIATEYIEGETLRSQINKSRQPLYAVLNVAIQIASALSVAHAKRIVHRDIKPENVMVRPDGYVKVLDFGLAKLTEVRASDPNNSTSLETEPGVVMGTVRYMSPEQTRGSQIDARTDIWSLGVVMYEAVSGRPPFEGGSASDVIVSILERDPPPLTGPAPEVPIEFVQIIQKCLKKNREERYQTMEELLEDLKRLKLGIESRGFNATTPIDQVRPRMLTRRRLVAAVGVILFFICAIVAYSLFNKSAAKHEIKISSLAVLPLKNLSGDPGQEYFADGMTEALTTDMARISELRVISTTTSMSYKNKNKPLPEIASELNVDGILEGSVSRAGNNVRIRVHLIQVLPTEQSVLTEEYDRNVRDILGLYREVARAVAQNIKRKLTPQDSEGIANARSVNPEAYEDYLRGTFYLNQSTPESTTKGLELLNEAIKKDPTNALPFAYLALGYATLGHGPSPPPDAFPRARAAALKALELDETVAEAHLVLAQLTMYDEKTWDWPSAERELKRAIELNPTLAAAHAHYAWYAVLFDRWDEGFAAMKQAQAVDPLTPLWPAWQGSLNWWIGRNEEAIKECQKALELNSKFPVALSILGRAYSDTGRHEEAIAAQQKAVEGNPSYLWSLAYAYARAGQRDKALTAAEEFKHAHADIYELATIYVALNDKEEAIRSLQAANDRNRISPWARNLRAFAPLRDDARFQDLLHQMNLPG